MRGDGRHAAVNPFAPGVDSGTVTTLVPAWTNTTTSVTGEVVTLDGRAIARASAAVYGFDLTTGAAQWHVDQALTSPQYQIKGVGEVTTIGTGATARVVMSEFEIGFDPQNPSVFAADGFTRWAPGADPNFAVSLPNAGITEVVSDGTTTFAVDNGVTFAMPAKGCGQASCPTSWSTGFTGHLTVVNGTLFGVDASGSLGAVPAAGCGGAVCLPTWTAPLTGAPLGLAVTGSRVFATSGSTLAVFNVDGCGTATCNPLWSSTTGAGLTAPSVVNDLVFTGGDAGHVQAWRTTGCGSPICDPIASLPQGSRVGNVTPISRALVFVVDGNLRKLMLPD